MCTIVWRSISSCLSCFCFSINLRSYSQLLHYACLCICIITATVLLMWQYHIRAHFPVALGNKGRDPLSSIPLEPFIDEKCSSFLRTFSKNKNEAPHVQALVLTLRANILMVTNKGAPAWLTPTSQEASLRRRAFFLAVATDLSKIPRELYMPGHEEAISLRASFGDIMNLSTRRLEQIQHVGCADYSAEVSKWKYLLSVGGNVCDCCGKSMAEASTPCLLQCSRCRLAHYCGASCQTKAWECGHSLHCKKFGVFEPGDRAILHSLRNSSDLNGMIVLVEGPMGDSDKYKVDLMGMKRLLCVKKKNLRHLRPQS